MIPDLSRTSVLVALGFVLLVAPAAVPLDPVLSHETRHGTHENESQLEAEGYAVIEYENLSERGQELYVETLRNGGTYTVAGGTGAPDFRYLTNAELGEVEDYRERERRTTVVIERPPNADLPPADERTERAAQFAEEFDDEEASQHPFANMTEDEIRAQIARYDLMQTRTVQPELTARPSLVRFGSAALGILTIGVGGYFGSRP